MPALRPPSWSPSLDAASAEFTIRLGEPLHLTTPAFQIGTEDILVITHPQAGAGPLTLEQVRGLFSGQISNWKDAGGSDLPVQVWSFAQDEDIQQIFDQTAMNGQPITSLACLAVSAQAMSDSVGSTAGSIGFLPRRWKAGSTCEAFKLATVPVLVISRTQPQGAIKDLISCLQAGQ